LVEIAEGASWERWNHTGAIQATLANTVRDAKQKKSPFYISDFHPFLIALEKKKKPGPRRKFDCVAPITILKDVFVDQAPISKVMQMHGIER